MTTFHFQTHISSDGEFALPPIPETFRGDDVVITIESVAKKAEDESVVSKKHVSNIMESTLIPGLMVTNWMDDTNDLKNDESNRETLLDEICGAWGDDERNAEEIIREIYESRTFGQEREPL